MEEMETDQCPVFLRSTGRFYSNAKLLFMSPHISQKSTMASYSIHKYQERDCKEALELFSKGMQDNISPTFYYCLKLPRTLVFLTGGLLVLFLATGSWFLTLLSGLSFLTALRLLIGYVWNLFVTDSLNTDMSDISKQYMSRQGSCFWVAKSEGRVVGTVGALPVSESALSREHLELFHLCVGSSHRGKGIAKALVRTVLQFGQDEGYTAVVLGTSKVQYAAVSLYQSMGFRRTHEYFLNMYTRLIHLTIFRFIYHIPSMEASKGQRLGSQ